MPCESTDLPQLHRERYFLWSDLPAWVPNRPPFLGMAAGHPRDMLFPWGIALVLFTHRFPWKGPAPLCKCPGSASGHPQKALISFWFLLGGLYCVLSPPGASAGIVVSSQSDLSLSAQLCHSLAMGPSPLGTSVSSSTKWGQ